MLQRIYSEDYAQSLCPDKATVPMHADATLVYSELPIIGLYALVGHLL